MKAKSETFAKFQESKTFIEKQTGSHIHTLRSHNGGEFDSHHFQRSLSGNKDQEGADNFLQPPAERGC